MGPKELQKNIKDKFKIDLPYMRLFNGKQHAMDSIYGNWQEVFNCCIHSKVKWRGQAQVVL